MSAIQFRKACEERMDQYNRLLALYKCTWKALVTNQSRVDGITKRTWTLYSTLGELSSIYNSI